MKQLLPPAWGSLTSTEHPDTTATTEVTGGLLTIKISIKETGGTRMHELTMFPAEALTLASDLENRVQEVMAAANKMGGAA